MGFDPASLAIASLVIGGIGTATSAAGSIASGNAAKANADYQAQVARNNAVISGYNANYVTQVGSEQATQSGLKAAAGLGKIKASQGASGIDVNSGSAAAVRAGQASTDRLDTMTILNNAALKAYGYKVQGASDTAQGVVDTAEGSQAQVAGDFGAAGTVLSGASSLGFKWAQTQGSGNPGTTSGSFDDSGNWIPG